MPQVVWCDTSAKTALAKLAARHRGHDIWFIRHTLHRACADMAVKCAARPGEGARARPYHSWAESGLLGCKARLHACSNQDHVSTKLPGSQFGPATRCVRAEGGWLRLISGKRSRDLQLAEEGIGCAGLQGQAGFGSR